MASNGGRGGNTSRPKKIRSSASPLTYLAGFCWTSAIVAVAFYAFRGQAPRAEAPSKPVIVTNASDMVFVPTPVRPVAKGERISDVSFARTEWPKQRVAKDFVQDLEKFKGARAMFALPAGLPIPTASLATHSNESNAVVDRIPQEMRAITVRVDAESAVEGWARPGDFVDVILLRQSKTSDVGIEAKVIAENVKILSAGRSTEPLGTKASATRAPATVTILVDQQNALKVKAAANIGRLTFALRGAGDDTPTLAKQIDQKSLLGGRAKSASKIQSHYLGKATGPDGRLYYLNNNAEWVLASGSGSLVEESRKRD